MFGYLKNIKGKQGVTLVTLVVTIIVIMILAGVTLVITLDSDLINSAKEIRVDTISEGIKDYAKGAMSAVVTDKNLTKNTIVSKFVEQVNKDNQTRTDADKHIIISVDEVNKIVKLEHREVEVEIDLTELEGHVVENDSDISKTIVDRYTIKFIYKDGETSKEKNMVVLSGQTLNQYLSSTGESIPKAGEAQWEPAVAYNSETRSNITYKEIIDTSEKARAVYDLNGGNINGETEIPAKTLNVGDLVPDPGIPTRENYTFDGWNPPLGQPIEVDTVFSAQWTPLQMTFTFKLNGGNISGSTSNVTTNGAYGSTSSTPTNPTRTHYTFTGWSPAVPATFDGNKTFTAQWAPVTYTFTYKLNGGNISGSTADTQRNGVYNSPAIKPADPVRINYTFDGWSPTVPATFDGNKTFTAQWTPVTFTYTYKLNGGNISGNTSDVTRTGAYNTASIKPSNPTRTNYTFDGWSPSVPATFDADRTFIALWKPVNYTFTFKLNGGNISGSTSDVTRSGAYDTASSKPANPTRTHYTFTGWSPAVPSVFDGNKTFTAQWTPVTYTFTFKLDGGNISGSTSDVTRSGEYNTTSSTPSNPTRSGYTFNGWSPSVPAKFDGNKIFTAQWTLNTYTITYNLNGGTYNNSSTNPTRTVSHGDIPPNLTPTKTGYEFMEWTPTLVAATKNATYTAVWSTPMIVEMKKATDTEEVLLPITLYSGYKYKVSINDAPYVEYTTGKPTITNNVPANTPFTVKIIGRIRAWDYNNHIQPELDQLYKLNSFGELGAEQYRFYGGYKSPSYITCKNLIGTIPSPNTNSFINITHFSSAFRDCSALTGSIPSGLFDNNPNVTTFFYTFYNCSGLTGSIPTGLFDNNPNVTDFSYTFYYCSGLTGSIPTGLFDNNPNVTTFNNTFFGCSGLTGSIPTGLFDNNPNVTHFSSTFSSCSKLTDIPTGLFDNNPNVTAFSSTFRSCSGLTDIPTGLFDNNPNVTNFHYTFSSCSKLTDIPTGLFDNNPNVTDFSYTFHSCSGLTDIPTGLFDNNPNVTHFSSTFSGCSGLTGSIPTGLFDNNPNVTSFSYTFGNCSKLTDIPTGLFDNNPNVTAFSSTFRSCSGLTGSIPTGLFDNNTMVTTFSYTFAYCSGLTDIPTGLFDNNTNVTTFAYTFYNCSGLTGSIPTGLFDNNPNVTDFSYTFASCSKLTDIPTGLFDNNPNVTSFYYTFYNCSGLTDIPTGLFDNNPNVTNFSYTFFRCSGLTGPAPELWTRTNVTSYTRCFYQCINLTNYADIPATWK